MSKKTRKSKAQVKAVSIADPLALDSDNVMQMTRHAVGLASYLMNLAAAVQARDKANQPARRVPAAA